MSDVVHRLAAVLQDRYRIERELGAGGMATVYLAHDLKHDRKVALKVLKPELAAVMGSERFLAEIRTTANLQHPHILPLFDSGEADGFLFFVMPHVEGESLRDRLDREKQLPVVEAVRIATEVADALAHAHAKGVIHRDIKPANILLRDGRVQVADFGIALAVQQAGGARLTETGLSVGTPHYMSPEQATGDRELDGRSDVYSLGCVLYEMLAGEPPHIGPTAQSILGKILTEEPRPLSQLRRSVPAHVEAAVQMALEKLPADRIPNAHEFAMAVSGAVAGSALLEARVRHGTARRLDLARGAGFGAAGTAAVAILATLLFRVGGDNAYAPVRRTSIILPDSAPLAFVGQATQGVGRWSLAISPDASTIVYVAQRDTTTQLFRRRLDDSAVEPIAGTEGAYQVFLSHDGRQVGFFAGPDLKTVGIDGGPVVTLGPQGEPAIGASWSEDGRILVSARDGTTLLWVSPSSGVTDSIVGLPFPFSLPKVLPGGRWAIGTVEWRTVALLSLETGDLFAVTMDGLVPFAEREPPGALLGADARYIRSGHLAYVRADGVLMALPFDLDRKKVVGEPRPVLLGVRRETPSGVGQYAVADDGTMIFAPGGNAGLGRLVWVDREGAVDTLPLPPQLYGQITLSPDGSRVAVVIHPPTTLTEIAVVDLDRPLALRRVSIPSGMDGVYWWPDGSALVASDFKVTVRQHPAADRPLDTLAADAYVSDVSADTLWLAACCHLRYPGLRLLHTSGGDSIIVDEHPGAWGGTFSHDGRWLAWTSPRTGRYEVWVMAMNPPGQPQQVSVGGGAEPRFSPLGDQLIYMAGPRLFVVDVPEEPAQSFSAPKLIYQGPKIDVLERGHDISPDGRRILMVIGEPADTVGRLEVVTGWFTELRRLAPGGGS